MLAGCSTTGMSGKRVDYKAEAVQVPSLEVPPDLTSPISDPRYKVQRGGDETVATYSDYSKDSAVVQNRGVLPEAKGVRLERNGTQRWLVVNDKPENVWPVVKAFWQATGLTIKSEDPAAGIMETDWVENRAKISQGAIRNVLGKVFDSLYSSGERDQYRTRLERSKDGTSTEIYISHRGLEETLDANKDTSKWQSRANDPEMEAIMLQRLMVRFGISEEQAAHAVATATADDAQGSAEAVNMQTTPNGSNIIVIGDTFDKSWRRVGLAIERAGLAIEDKDRIKGIYFLRASAKEESGWTDKLMFWKGNKGTDKSYRVIVKDGVSSCEVTAADQHGANDDTSKRMLEAIYKNIKQ
jgi:outer membrane protein assembly factor BamC